jgi:peptide deformylase
MSEIIKFNTEELAKVNPLPPVQVKILELVPEDHPILREALLEFDFDNPPVNPNEFASSLVETCKLNRGIGLSANQCGYPYRVFVMGADDNYVAFFNPIITSVSDDTVHMLEGCLSFPLLGLKITRPKEIHVSYQDFNGVKREAKYEGLSARCFQHEFDHMNGVTFKERVKPLALEMGLKKRKKIAKGIKLK